MNVRPRTLPHGWYPEAAADIRMLLTSWQNEETAGENGAAAAGIVPHAGWYFSGKIAYRVIRELAGDIETVVIAGGHLQGSSPVVAAREDFYATPLGNVRADKELLSALDKLLATREDRFSDNSCEVQLPIVKYLFPEAEVLMIRVPPDERAVEIGRMLGRISKETGKRIGLIGSTDLTHYGPVYNFMPEGSGVHAVQWVREVNDSRMLDLFTAMDAEAALNYALLEKAACSPGGAVAAIQFAKELGIEKGRLIEYANSYDKHPSDSFVGYGGIVYS